VKGRAWSRTAASARDGVFMADEVLAKHDEKYMPPEVARSLKKNSEAMCRRMSNLRQRAGPTCRAAKAHPHTGAGRKTGGNLMLPELGHFALILALLLAAAAGIFRHRGPGARRDRWVSVVTPAVAGQFCDDRNGFGCLVRLVRHAATSRVYVAAERESALPLVYRVAAVWAGA